MEALKVMRAMAMKATSVPSALQVNGLQEDLLPPPPARAALLASQAQLDSQLQVLTAKVNPIIAKVVNPILHDLTTYSWGS